MEILVTGPSIKGLKGGQATHMENIMKVFSSDKNCELSYFFSSTAKEGAESKLVKMLKLIVNIFFFPFRLFGKKIVHINSSFDDKALIRDFFFLFWCVLFQKRFIVQYHGGLLGNTKIGQVKIFCILWLKMLSNAKHVLVLTDEQLLSLNKLNFNDVTKITNFVEVSKELPTTEKPFIFLFLGRLVKEKGIFDILESTSKLLGQYNFDVLFYGDGDDRNLLVEEIKIRNLQSNVKWLGSVEGKAKTDAYLAASTFLLPTYYPEGMPYSVLEAMSFGVPVICSRIGALPELVINDETGLLVKERDLNSLVSAMTRLLKEEDTRKLLSENSRNLITSQYSFEVMKEKFTELWLF